MQLPTLSRVKLDQLLRQSQEAYDAVASITRRASDLKRSLLTAPASDAEAIKVEIERLHERQSDLAAKHRNFADLSAAIEHWLAANRDTLEYQKPPKVAPEKGETVSAAIIRVRSRIATLYHERTKVQRAAVPIAELKASATRHVNSLRERGASRIMRGTSMCNSPSRKVGRTKASGPACRQFFVG